MRPVPLLILITVGSVLVLSSFPILLEPLPAPSNTAREERDRLIRQFWTEWGHATFH